MHDEEQTGPSERNRGCYPEIKGSESHHLRRPSKFEAEPRGLVVIVRPQELDWRRRGVWEVDVRERGVGRRRC